MKRLEAEWQSYKTVVIPVDAPEIQFRESKKAFYAGARSLLSLLVSKESPNLISELDSELNEFLSLVKKGIM
jgi:hypothetical protein